MPGFSSDRISGRKPNLNIKLDTRLKLKILKHIQSKNEQLLIQTFNMQSFSTLIFYVRLQIQFYNVYAYDFITIKHSGHS